MRCRLNVGRNFIGIDAARLSRRNADDLDFFNWLVIDCLRVDWLDIQCRDKSNRSDKDCCLISHETTEAHRLHSLSNRFWYPAGCMIAL